VSFLFEIEEEGGERRVVVEDNDQTVYAYLLRKDEIVSDVWLHNSAPLETYPLWNNPDELPFPNRPDFIAEGEPFSMESAAQLSCQWDQSGVDLFIDGVRAARMNEGVSPGASRFVAKDGPLGRRLID
jgi:hypothetical protein